MNQVQKHLVTEDEIGLRIDRWFLRKFPFLNNGALQKLLRTGQVRIDGSRTKGSKRLKTGQTIRIPPLDNLSKKISVKLKPDLSSILNKNTKKIKALVIYRDDDLIALNKPSGLAVQGGTNVAEHLDSMLEGLRFGASERPKLVHRLDKGASGLLLVARNAFSANRITKAFRNRKILKTYWALVAGIPPKKFGQISATMKKMGSPGSQKMQLTKKGGKNSETQFQIIERAGTRVAWLALEPITGRTHQLRVHCNLIGTPILGDGKYGGSRAFLENSPNRKLLHLHSRSLGLEHPRGGWIELEAPLSKEMERSWLYFGFNPDRTDGSFNKKFV
mgnify:CR=1 FL=1